MVKKDPTDLRLEAEERKKRMEDLEARIGMTESGSRFIDRIYEIGRPRPLHSDDQGE